MRHDVFTEEWLAEAKKKMGKPGVVGDEETERMNLALYRQANIATADTVSSPAPSPKKREYDSKWEETYASELVLRKHAGLIRNYWYHPFSMWLPGKVRYTPDFMIEHPKGYPLEIVEVKGWSKNLRDGMTRLKIAAAIFDCYTWKLVKKKKGGGWDEEEVS